MSSLPGRVWKFMECNQLLIYKVKKLVQTTHLSAFLPFSTMGQSPPPFFLVLWSLLRRKKTRHFFQEAERCFLGFCLFVSAVLWGMQDLSSLSRDRTCASCVRSAGSSPDHQGSPKRYVLKCTTCKGQEKVHASKILYWVQQWLLADLSGLG